MKKLSSITLVAYDGPQVDRTVRAMNHCSKLFEFGHVKLWTSKRPTLPFSGEIVMVEEIGYQGCSWWDSFGIEIDTAHCLTVQHDGMIVNPDRWDDAWLQYDYIGAPWPEGWAKSGHIKDTNRVGNGGFSLRSKRFVDTIRQFPLSPGQEPGDVYNCQTRFEEMSARGIKYAPPDVAGMFSWENGIEENTATPLSFGWHGVTDGKKYEHYQMIQNGRKVLMNGGSFFIVKEIESGGDFPLPDKGVK